MSLDPLAMLSEIDVTVAWTRNMPWPVLWLPEEGVAVLNASIPRQRLADEVTSLMQADPCERP